MWMGTVHSQLKSLRPWLAAAAILLALGAGVPPVATAARHYAFAQALEFCLFAVVVPALLVIGAPWRLRVGGQDRPTGSTLADRVAMARSHRPGQPRAWMALIGFLAVVIAWRLPVAGNALARHPALTAAEAVTLIGAGVGLWLELVESPPLLPTIGRPLRAAFAAIPMWTIWAIGYIMGFSGGAWFTALAHRSGHGLSTAADQEIASAILWAIPAVCFVPVVYFSLITWLRDSSEPASELREAAAAYGDRSSAPGAASQSAARDASAPGTPRPPRGWRTPSA
jgi:cytochrome c oxidase assembly factor CtaG